MDRPLRSIHAKARIARGWSVGFYVAGIAAVGAGILATGSAAGFGVAAAIAAAGVTIGGLGLWESRRFDRHAKHLESTISEHRVFALAEKHGGVLRVVDVARGLHIMSAEAEALLDGFVDEVRVSMRVTDEGEIDYVFRELVDPGNLRIRMAAAETERVEEAASDTSRYRKPSTD
jgi:hypothetical protein